MPCSQCLANNPHASCNNAAPYPRHAVSAACNTCGSRATSAPWGCPDCTPPRPPRRPDGSRWPAALPPSRGGPVRSGCACGMTGCDGRGPQCTNRASTIRQRDGVYHPPRGFKAPEAEGSYPLTKPEPEVIHVTKEYTHRPPGYRAPEHECREDDCMEGVEIEGWYCLTHYVERARSYIDEPGPPIETCMAEECLRPVREPGITVLCMEHHVVGGGPRHDAYADWARGRVFVSEVMREAFHAGWDARGEAWPVYPEGGGPER